MKRFFFVLLDILAIAFLAGGYVIQYFTKRKLGMRRWVNFRGMKLEAAVPVDIVKYAAAIVMLILTILIVGRYLKKRAEMTKIDAVMMVILAAFSAGYLGLTFFLSGAVTPAYFLILPLAGASVLMLLIRNLIAVWTCKHEK